MNTNIISVISGLGGMFGWGVSDFFANISSEKIGHIKTFFWSQVAGTFVLGLLYLVINPSFVIPNAYLWIALIFSAFFYGWGYLYFYKAFELGMVSVISATINLNVIIAMVLAMIFFGENLTGWQIPAVIMVILGVVLVTVNFSDFKKANTKLAEGVKEAIIASILFGIYWNISQYFAEAIGWLPTTFFVKIAAIGMLALWSIYKKDDLKIKSPKPSLLTLVAAVGILETFAVASVDYGLEIGNLVLVSPISSALSLVTIGMAVIFLKEKISKIQTLGIALTIAGIVMSAL